MAQRDAKQIIPLGANFSARTLRGETLARAKKNIPNDGKSSTSGATWRSIISGAMYLGRTSLQYKIFQYPQIAKTATCPSSKPPTDGNHGKSIKHPRPTLFQGATSSACNKQNAENQHGVVVEPKYLLCAGPLTQCAEELYCYCGDLIIKSHVTFPACAFSIIPPY